MDLRQYREQKQLIYGQLAATRQLRKDLREEPPSRSRRFLTAPNVRRKMLGCFTSALSAKTGSAPPGGNVCFVPILLQKSAIMGS